MRDIPGEPSELAMSAAPRRRIRVVALVTIVFAIQFCAWSMLVEHNTVRAVRVLEALPDQEARNLAVLSSDLLEYRDYFRDFPTRFDELTLQRSFVEYYKRPLYGPITASLNVVASQTFGIGFPERMHWVSALYASAAVMLLAGVLRAVSLPALQSGLLTALCAASFAWAPIFSIPESYSLSLCGVLVAILSGHSLPEARTPLSRAAAFGHAVVAGVAAWLYLPALGAVFLVASRIVHPRQWLTLVAPATILATMVAILPHVYWGTSSLQYQLAYGDRWSSADRLLDPQVLGHVGAAFLFFSVLSPVGDFVYAPPDVNLAAAVSGWPVAAGIIALLVIYGALAFIAVRGRFVTRMQGALLWLACLYLFHAIFNPHEVLLYLSVPAAVLCYLVAIPLAAVGDRRATIWGLTAALAFVVAHNAAAILGAGS